tara:strand:+ start:206313 stop:206945 length:633 start_codon:yes stop_codon:yes gene_type:complete
MDDYNEQVDDAVDGATQDGVSQWEPADLLDRPKWPKVVGVISILFASFGLTCGSVITVVGVIMPSLVEGGLDGDPVPDGMVMHGIDYFYAGFGLALAALLLIAGITAVTYRPLTRVLHLIYAACTIPLTILNYLNQTAKQASIFEWAEQYPNNQISQNMDPNSIGSSVGQIIGLAFMIVLGFGIPTFYLIWFGLLKTKPEQITGGDEGVY